MAQTGRDRRAIPPEARESRWIAGDGHAIRRIDWPADTAAPRGAILFLPGRGDHYEKYVETLAHWHDCGWRVTALDWRGQGGSGRLGTDAVTGHVADFALWVEDLARFWGEWSADAPGPHVLVGHSMGGHLALRAMAEGRVDPAAAVLTAPMLGLHPGAVPPALLHLAARLIAQAGDPRRPAWTWSEKPGVLPAGRANLLTHDPARYADEAWWRASRPELVMGPGSWGWVAAALASMRRLERRGALEGVRAPVLLLATTADRLVEYRAIARAAQRLPHGQLLTFGAEAHHELLREVDAVRGRVLGAIDAFLAHAAEAPR